MPECSQPQRVLHCLLQAVACQLCWPWQVLQAAGLWEGLVELLMRGPQPSGHQQALSLAVLMLQELSPVERAFLPPPEALHCFQPVLQR